MCVNLERDAPERKPDLEKYKMGDCHQTKGF